MHQVVPRIRAGGKLVGVGGNSPADAAGIAEFIKPGAGFITISSLARMIHERGTRRQDPAASRSVRS